MMNAVYHLEGHTALSQPCAAGPWDPGMQHGGAPASLIAWVAEQIPASEPMQVARLTVDLLRPVPIAPLEIRTEVLRAGRKIQVCEITLLHEGVVVVRATVLKIRSVELSLPDTALEEKVLLPGPQAGREPKNLASGTNTFVAGLSLRIVQGSFRQPGPAAIWFHAHRPLIAGQPLSALMRTAMAADFCNGASSVLDIRGWTFINADLTISLARLPVGEWILLDAQTWLGRHGSGIAFAKLADERGYFGRAVQSVVLERRTAGG